MRPLLRPLLCACLLLLAVTAPAGSNTLSPATYNALNDIQTLISEEKYSEAESTLNDLAADLNPGFGLALTYQLYGQLYLIQEQQDKALTWYRKSLALDALAPAQEAGLATTVAQLLLAREDYPQAVTELQPRIERFRQQEKEDAARNRQQDKEPAWILQPISFVTLASAYQLQKNYAASIPALEEAVARLRARGEAVKENWLQMLMAAYYQTQNYPRTAKVLDDLLRINPGKEDYWQQQTAVFQLLEKPALALRTLELGYSGGYVRKADSILLLVQMLLAQNIPDRAGRILQRHLDDGTIELNERNWKLLAAAWQQGRERDKAIPAILKASEFMQDGILILRAARLSIQDGNPRRTLELTEAALKKGLQDKDKPSALMLAGSSACELNELNTARRYFQQALSFADTAGNARAWLDYIAALETYPVK